MRVIKDILSEGLIKKQAGVDMKTKIENWLKENEIEDYEINSDLTIDVDTDKSISIEGDLPEYIQFKNVNCFRFDWYGPTTLKGGPIGLACRYSFNVTSKELETLEYCPKVIRCKFNFSGCPSLKTLKHLPNNCSVYIDRLDFEYLIKNVWGVKVHIEQYS